MRCEAIAGGRRWQQRSRIGWHTIVTMPMCRQSRWVVSGFSSHCDTVAVAVSAGCYTWRTAGIVTLLQAEWLQQEPPAAASSGTEPTAAAAEGSDADAAADSTT